MSNLDSLRENIRAHNIIGETGLIDDLISISGITEKERLCFTKTAIKLVEDIRSDDQPGLMEVFLAEYGLSTDEGVALMCLAEALLRVPDSETIDDLIEDKIAPSAWGEHLGKSSSSLVNASTWGLMLTGRVLDDVNSHGVAKTLHGLVKRVGEPVIRLAVKRAMKELGGQFVLGENIAEAVKYGKSMEKQGFTYSYDMLGEAALTQGDAQIYLAAYKRSITYLAKQSKSDDIRLNPGISIKLSALHPRYEARQKNRVMTELVPQVLKLCLQAKAANMGLNIDAEEADRLDLSLDIIQAVLSDERLAGWNGFGVVVQAYGKRASVVIDWLYQLAGGLDRKIMVRLVKGAYWDTEIKRAQVEGLSGFPVFTRKESTDVSYICCAKKLLGFTDRIYPQFATHNAYSAAAILEMSDDYETFEFQRLHGMGTVLHRLLHENHHTRCRIYAPVGAHEDLLAYLVRRLLENGANSSFVNQIVDASIPPEDIAVDPFKGLSEEASTISIPSDIFMPERINSKGWDINDVSDMAEIEDARAPFIARQWQSEPIIAKPYKGGAPQPVFNPANPSDCIGKSILATPDDAELALSSARPWQTSAANRHRILNKAADFYEENFGEIFAVLAREAGKTLNDAIGELREAIDFLRYYAAQIETLEADTSPCGIIICISPWNFPLAIFTGQISAALAAGNGVIAKPAEPTPIIASLAVKLLHKAGVPKTTLQLLPGAGRIIGAQLVSDPRIDGICFTGSIMTAQSINSAMADAVAPDAPLIAETGGLNAMIVDSTALPEQAVKDIVTSAFQSAGQRCSALRLLYVQEDVAPAFMEMLFGAMEEQAIGAPWSPATDIGPIITTSARSHIAQYVEQAKQEGRLLKAIPIANEEAYIGPTVVSVKSIKDMNEEIFGPVLHIATFKPSEIDRIIDDINASGYGLTFGLHTRIDGRVEHLVSRLDVGNIYVNRNQIGAIVGSQPFGGEGLSGTGPKAGGPHYIHRFVRQNASQKPELSGNKQTVAQELVAQRLEQLGRPEPKTLSVSDLPGPTGESNRLSLHPRGVILCLGPTTADAREQARLAEQMGCKVLMICSGIDEEGHIEGYLNPEALETLTGFDAVALWGDEDEQKAARIALSRRNCALIPLICSAYSMSLCLIERHVCVDTTASGGNVSLLQS